MTPADRCRSFSLVLFTGVLTASLLSSSSAHAQSADAEALFRQGKTLIKKGDLAGGCDKLAASEKLESSIGTLLNLGDCREKLGKYASAWAAFRRAEAMAQRSGTDDKRRGEAAKRAAALEPKLANVVIEVKSKVDGLVVKRDDETLEPATFGTPLPVDPGKIVLTAEAPGFQSWRTEIEIDPASKHRVVEVPPLVPSPKPIAPAPTQQVTVAQPGTALQPTYVTRRVEHGTWSGARKFSLVLGLAGAGALGTGAYFGVHSKHLQDDANRLCPESTCNDPAGLDYNDRAKQSARTANILYISGGAAVATALVVWLVGGPSDETIVVPTVGDGSVGLSLSGRL